MGPAISELAVGGGLSLKLQHHPDPLKRESDGVEVTGSALWDAAADADASKRSGSVRGRLLITSIDTVSME